MVQIIFGIFIGTLCGYAIACIMLESGRESREEEKRELNDK